MGKHIRKHYNQPITSDAASKQVISPTELSNNQLPMHQYRPNLGQQMQQPSFNPSNMHNKLSMTGTPSSTPSNTPSFNNFLLFIGVLIIIIIIVMLYMRYCSKSTNSTTSSSTKYFY